MSIGYFVLASFTQHKDLKTHRYFVSVVPVSYLHFLLVSDSPLYG